IQRHKHRFRINAGKTYIERVSKPTNLVAILLRIRKNVCDASPQLVAQLGPAFLLRLAITRYPSGSGSHSRDSGHVFRPGTPLIFVCAAEHDWLDRKARAKPKKACTLWSIELVRSKTSDIDERDIDIHFPERLDHVAVKQHAALSTYL